MSVGEKHLYIFGNWKMAQDFAAARSFVQSWSEPASELVTASIFPSDLHCAELVRLAQKSFLKVGAQNCSNESSGAFTGEVSAAMLKEVGLSYVLIGHSERRARFKESSEWLGQKVEQALSAGLVPVFCIGETKDQREAGHLEDVLDDQISALSQKSKEAVIVAYEPVWAIGTGLVPKLEEMSEAHGLIQKRLPGRPILYGGSVKPENSKEILALPEVAGLLIGGASLKPESFSKIYRFALESCR